MKQATAISLLLLGLLGAVLFAPRNVRLAPPSAQAQIPVNVRTISLLSNDIVYDPYAKLIYASVPSSAGANGNSIAVINPATGAVGPYIFIGSEPNKLALTDDGKYLYVSLDGAATVRRLNLTTRIPDAPFTLGTGSFGPLYAEEIEARPGCTDEVAVSLRRPGVSPRHGGVALYRNGVRQTDVTQEHTGSNVIEFCSSPAWLYGLNNETTEFGFRRIAVGDNGLKQIDVVGNLLNSNFSSGDFKCDGGVAYGTSGRIVDPGAKALLGTFDLTGGSGSPFGFVVRPDSTTGRVFFLNSSSSATTTRIRAFDQTTFLPLGFIDVTNSGGTAASLIRWGGDGLAYRVSNQTGQTGMTGQIVLVQSPFISGISAGPVTTSAASFLGGRAAPESIATLFGSELSTTTTSATAIPLPLSLAGVSLKVKDALGSERPAPLFFVSPTQINYQLPAGTAPGTAMVIATNDSGRTSTGSVNVAASVPGLFSANANGTGPAAGLALRVKADNSQSFEPIVEFDAAQNRAVLRPIDLGPATDRVFLVLFGTGLRGRSDLAKVIGRVGCADATVAYLGAQGVLVGLDQANLLIPRSQIGRGETTVALTLDGQTTNLVTVNIK